MSAIHPTALVDPRARLGEGVTVDAYSIIGAEVVVGAGTTIGSHVVLEGRTTIGAACVMGHGVVIGTPPQDRKYAGEPTAVLIGDRTQLREYVTVHRATMARGTTVIGHDCLLMAYVHVAHDCAIGDGTVIANAVQLAGHVTIGRSVTIGGLTPIHQFVRIGDYAMVGGGSRVPQDVPPFMRAVGDPLRLVGVNTVGLTRAGLAPADRDALARASRLLFNSSRSRSEALEELAGAPAPVGQLVAFVTSSERGVVHA